MLHAQSNFFTLDFFHQTSSIFLLTTYIFHLTSYIIHIVVSLFFRSWQGDGKVLASINSLLELANPLPTLWKNYEKRPFRPNFNKRLEKTIKNIWKCDYK